MSQTVSRVAAIRKRRQIPVAELARMVGVSRQTIYAIEDGTFVPNTTVALRLSRVLGVTVEELFALEENSETPFELEFLFPHRDGHAEGQPVRLCSVGDRVMAVPGFAVPAYLPEADAVMQGRGVRVVSQPSGDRLLLAGCDPGLSLIKPAGIEIITVPASSQRALEWLHAGKIHAAGSHLFDSRTGDYNVPFVRSVFSPGAARVITFAAWRQGLLVRRGNPKGLVGPEDLARTDVLFVNREEGSGSRKLLDTALLALDIPAASVRGYGTCAPGHLEVARRIASGEADAGIATESAARHFGLEFLPLAAERFDLTFTDISLPSVQALINTLASAAFRNRLQIIAGYDTAETGKIQL